MRWSSWIHSEKQQRASEQPETCGVTFLALQNITLMSWDDVKKSFYELLLRQWVPAGSCSRAKASPNSLQTCEKNKLCGIAPLELHDYWLGGHCEYMR